ncbi:hypothetical protein [Dongia sp.]|uniref:hypothetical protein n=1 Tax=Dongia sp. TaxID=1977262 RepID=UPI0035B33A86
MASTSYGPQHRPPLRPQADQQEPAAGRWVDGQFTFATPEAEEAWQRSAYQQAVNEKTWHLGDKIDDQTRDAILAGIGGATRPMYQGPDGQYYFQNARTLEDPSARSHRAQHVAGKTIDQIAAAGKIPGEDEYVAARRAPPPKPANNNERTSSPENEIAGSALEVIGRTLGSEELTWITAAGVPTECIERCYRILERPRTSAGSDKNQYDFYKCLADCERSLMG